QRIRTPMTRRNEPDSRSWKVWSRFALFAVLLPFFAANCRLERAHPDRPNVILILIDALRADRLGCYGYSRPTSPVIDALAKRSSLFESAYANACWTKPSIPTLFTGLYPRQHQVFLGDNRDTEGHISSDVLNGSFETVAEHFKSAGYETAAFVNNAQIRKF